MTVETAAQAINKLILKSTAKGEHIVNAINALQVLINKANELEALKEKK